MYEQEIFSKRMEDVLFAFEIKKQFSPSYNCTSRNVVAMVFDTSRQQFLKQLLALSICPFFHFKNNDMINAKGITIRQSQYTVKDSIDRLQAFLLRHEATIYARINQQAELNNVGIEMLPLEFIMFGNPKGGGQLMARDPLIALDLPLKVIAWEDDEKKVWLAYNEPAYIEARYSIPHIGNSPLDLDHIIDMALKN